MFNSGNLVLDLLHNFFLESGARTHKARVYEVTSNETARTMIGYLLVRGGVHQAAYGLAVQKLTGVDMTKMLPLPNIDNEKFEHTVPWQTNGEHAKLYAFSPSDYMQLGAIWNGKADWADGARRSKSSRATRKAPLRPKAPITPPVSRHSTSPKRSTRSQRSR